MEQYEEQLNQVNAALQNCQDASQKEELLSLRESLTELLSLTKNAEASSSSNNDDLQDEYALFMSEMAKEGAVVDQKEKEMEDYKKLEGMKCRAPHVHQWGGTAYHNAMVCSVLTPEDSNEEAQARILFLNPTHKEMIPCPYYFENECKFSEDKCHFSHGELVPVSSLQEYIEPQFENLTIGSSVLAKQPNKMWHRGKVKSMGKENCVVKLESSQNVVEVEFEDLFPMVDDNSDSDLSSDSEAEEECANNEDIINMSLMVAPSDQALGNWEKYTKGIGSKLMAKMGYVIGTGLGKKAEGRVDPVSAVILPAGKSLDHCMMLRENAGGDKDLFSVERKMKRLQKKQEIQSQKTYEREKKKVDVFNFINTTLSEGTDKKEQYKKSKHREEIKKETSRNLNVAGLQIDENMRRIQTEMYKVKESLTRHKDAKSAMNKNLNEKLFLMEKEMKKLESQALNIKNEQSVRSDKRKLTIF